MRALEARYLGSNPSILTMNKTFRTILITAISTLVLAIGFSVYAFTNPAFEKLRDISVSLPSVNQNTRYQTTQPSQQNNNQVTTQNNLSATEIRFRAIEARLTALEAKNK